jgi:DNA-binding MarR family transcriptional regulator
MGNRTPQPAERRDAAERRDLAAMIEPLRTELIRTEIEVLAEHGLTMWAYIVLLNLTDEPIRTQSALAEAIRADRTRIIDVLDDLQLRGLISRRPDPADRRARLLSLTAEGRTLRDTAQAAIQSREERLLVILGQDGRDGFLTALRQLSEAPARALLAAQPVKEVPPGS